MLPGLPRYSSTLYLVLNPMIAVMQQYSSFNRLHASLTNVLHVCSKISYIYIYTLFSMKTNSSFIFQITRCTEVLTSCVSCVRTARSLFIHLIFYFPLLPTKIENIGFPALCSSYQMFDYSTTCLHDLSILYPFATYFPRYLCIVCKSGSKHTPYISVNNIWNWGLNSDQLDNYLAMLVYCTFTSWAIDFYMALDQMSFENSSTPHLSLYLPLSPFISLYLSH